MNHEESAQHWLATARERLAGLVQLRPIPGQDVRNAAVSLVGELAHAVDLLEAARVDSSEAGFEAACAIAAAADLLVKLAAAGADADPWELAHAAWLLGRGHMRAQVKVSAARKQPGRPRGSGDPVRPFIEAELQTFPDLSYPQIVERLARRGHETTASTVGKVARAMKANGRK